MQRQRHRCANGYGGRWCGHRQPPCSPAPASHPPPPPRSIAMIHRQSRGQLPLFVQGLEAFKRLKVGWEVVVACYPQHAALHCTHAGSHAAWPLHSTIAISSPFFFSAPPLVLPGRRQGARGRSVQPQPHHRHLQRHRHGAGGWRRGPLPLSCLAAHADCSFLVHAYSCVALCIGGACSAPSASCPPTAPALHPCIPPPPDPRQGCTAGRAWRDGGPRLWPRVPGAGRTW